MITRILYTNLPVGRQVTRISKNTAFNSCNVPSVIRVIKNQASISAAGTGPGTK
jgi:hypothetical protein